MAENGLFGTPLLTPQSPPKKFMSVLFCVLSQELRHINFPGCPKWGVLGGRQKVYVEKVFVPVCPLKSAQRLTFWVRTPLRGVGVFHAKGWRPKSSCSPSKVCLPWVSKRGIWDVPGILSGCPGPLGVFKKFVQKKFVHIFVSLME